MKEAEFVKRNLGLLLALMLILASLGTASASPTEIQTKHVHALQNKPIGQAAPGANGITYHKGPIMTGTPSLYVIWYGNWSGNTATTILPDFLSHLGGSPWYNINSTYYNGSSVHLTNALSNSTSTTDNYSLGTALSDANIQTIVASAISSGRLPSNTNGIYLVLTSSDVSETSGFLTQYCGWHTHGTIGGADIKYAFIGDPAKNYAACAAQSASSPNNNISADAMASVIAHEIAEAASDPDLNAWYDNRGNENADKCAWTFGTESTASNGSQYNVALGTRQYLIQRNWVNASGGLCAMSY
jgi:hypothetical protein